MSDLVAFLRARLEEDEAAAKAAADPPRHRGGGFTWTQADPVRQPGLIGDGVGEVVTYDEGSPTVEQAAHIARHDPARVLREVEAKRKILDQLATDLSYQPPVPPGHQRAWAIATQIAEVMAAVYSDHPDYDPAWT